MDNTELLNLALSLDPGLKAREKADRPAVSVPVEKWAEVARRLRDDSRFKFDMLCAYTAIDWPAQNQIELVCELYSTTLKHYLMVSVYLGRAQAVSPSVSDLWQIAEWQEREIFDMFGVRFSNHPDLRRLFLEDEWVGFPLLKDYKDEFMLERPWGR